MTVPVNPHEGQVAIPYSIPEAGYVVGCLGARAMAWFEEARGGRTIDDVWADVVARQGSTTSNLPSAMPVQDASTILWVSIEHYRRRAKLPGPEFDLEDGEELVDELGLDAATRYAVMLISLAASFRERRKSIREFLIGKGIEDPDPPLLAEAMAAAETAGTGTPSSPLPSTQGSPTETPGT